MVGRWILLAVIEAQEEVGLVPTKVEAALVLEVELL